MLANDRTDDQSPTCVRADFPFPPRIQATAYFEISIARIAEHAAALDLAPPTVTLGFCGEFCDLTHAHPGWNVWSVGYHSDDCGIFEENGSDARCSTGFNFGAGDTIGCGIDYATAK